MDLPSDQSQVASALSHRWMDPANRALDAQAPAMSMPNLSDEGDMFYHPHASIPSAGSGSDSGNVSMNSVNAYNYANTAAAAARAAVPGYRTTPGKLFYRIHHLLTASVCNLICIIPCLLPHTSSFYNFAV